MQNTLDTYNPVKLSDLPKGEYFTLNKSTTVVYSKGAYDRTNKTWFCPKATDISVERILKGATIVYTGFTY
jgi:hypothetical protein